MAQTATEWLHDQLTKVWYDVKSSKELLEQAKEMEKQQIKDAYESLEHRHGENYYNETFKQVTNKN